MLRIKQQTGSIVSLTILFTAKPDKKAVEGTKHLAIRGKSSASTNVMGQRNNSFLNVVAEKYDFHVGGKRRQKWGQMDNPTPAMAQRCNRLWQNITVVSLLFLCSAAGWWIISPGGFLHLFPLILIASPPPWCLCLQLTCWCRENEIYLVTPAWASVNQILHLWSHIVLMPRGI